MSTVGSIGPAARALERRERSAAAAPGTLRAVSDAPPPVSAHFVNNVLAAAASYIDDEPETARDVIAELGQFLSFRLRDPAPVSLARELEHVTTYVRLEQARFPGRIDAKLPGTGGLPAVQVDPASVQAPLAAALGRRLREVPGPCAVALEGPSGDYVFALALGGPNGAGQERIEIRPAVRS
jgi:LytS/YehU family sensor histidine kinase